METQKGHEMTPTIVGFLPLANVSNGPLWTHGHDADTSAPHHEEDLRPSEASLLIMLTSCGW